MSDRPMVGLALGGGFLRGTAHIGVLKVFRRAGIPVDMVAGTSAGSIMAALYASGHSPEEMEKIALGLRHRDLFDYGPTLVNLLLIACDLLGQYTRLPVPGRRPLGLMKGAKLEAMLDRLLGKKRLLSETQIPVGITAVDARDGTLVVFRAGEDRERDTKGFTLVPPQDVYLRNVPLARAIRASIAVPGLFEPVKLEGRLLVDGGLRENVPSYVLRQMGADLVIAVDVGYDGHRAHALDNIVDLLVQSLEIVSSESINLKLERYADLLIRPVIKNMGSWDFGKVKYCIGRGEFAATNALDDIKKRL
ncbi:MAG: patatin-like phospholipase family protein [Firmicutes bacterium]|nr:patatin-like phospholipase family protein [Bacillota bacterium]